VAFWLAVSEVRRWVLMRHLGFDGKPDGLASWVLVKKILQALDWKVTQKPADLRKQFEAWLRTLPAARPVAARTRQVGKLRIVVPPPAPAPVGKPRRRPLSI
jgi:hypothetical protein